MKVVKTHQEQKPEGLILAYTDTGTSYFVDMDLLKASQSLIKANNLSTATVSERDYYNSLKQNPTLLFTWAYAVMTQRDNIINTLDLVECLEAIVTEDLTVPPSAVDSIPELTEVPEEVETTPTDNLFSNYIPESSPTAPVSQTSIEQTINENFVETPTSTPIPDIEEESLQSDLPPLPETPSLTDLPVQAEPTSDDLAELPPELPTDLSEQTPTDFTTTTYQDLSQSVEETPLEIVQPILQEAKPFTFNELALMDEANKNAILAFCQNATNYTITVNSDDNIVIELRR